MGDNSSASDLDTGQGTRNGLKPLLKTFIGWVDFSRGRGAPKLLGMHFFRNKGTHKLDLVLRLRLCSAKRVRCTNTKDDYELVRDARVALQNRSGTEHDKEKFQVEVTPMEMQNLKSLQVNRGTVNERRPHLVLAPIRYRLVLYGPGNVPSLKDREVFISANLHGMMASPLKDVPKFRVKYEGDASPEQQKKIAQLRAVTRAGMRGSGILDRVVKSSTKASKSRPKQALAAHAGSAGKPTKKSGQSQAEVHNRLGRARQFTRLISLLNLGQAAAAAGEEAREGEEEDDEEDEAQHVVALETEGWKEDTEVEDEEEADKEEVEEMVQDDSKDEDYKPPGSVRNALASQSQDPSRPKRSPRRRRRVQHASDFMLASPSGVDDSRSISPVGYVGSTQTSPVTSPTRESVKRARNKFFPLEGGSYGEEELEEEMEAESPGQVGLHGGYMSEGERLEVEQEPVYELLEPLNASSAVTNAADGDDVAMAGQEPQAGQGRDVATASYDTPAGQASQESALEKAKAEALARAMRVAHLARVLRNQQRESAAASPFGRHFAHELQRAVDPLTYSPQPPPPPPPSPSLSALSSAASSATSSSVSISLPDPSGARAPLPFLSVGTSRASDQEEAMHNAAAIAVAAANAQYNINHTNNYSNLVISPASHVASPGSGAVSPLHKKHRGKNHSSSYSKSTLQIATPVAHLSPSLVKPQLDWLLPLGTSEPVPATPSNDMFVPPSTPSNEMFVPSAEQPMARELDPMLTNPSRHGLCAPPLSRTSSLNFPSGSSPDADQTDFFL
eukprot:g83075.t1